MTAEDKWLPTGSSTGVVQSEPGFDGDALPILRAVNISKTYGDGEAEVAALRDCSIELEQGTITVVVGPSGSGKSTLMHVLSGLEVPTTGKVWLGGVPISELSEAERARWRSKEIGFVLQRDNLIPSLTVVENVAAPLILAGNSRSESLQLALEALEAVGLSHRANAWPATVSGGEAQRAAVARACAGTPSLIFSDEPTGALDSASSKMVLDQFVALSRRKRAATVLVTHDPEATRIADRVVRIEDGEFCQTV